VDPRGRGGPGWRRGDPRGGRGSRGEGGCGNDVTGERKRMMSPEMTSQEMVL